MDESNAYFFENNYILIGLHGNVIFYFPEISSYPIVYKALQVCTNVKDGILEFFETNPEYVPKEIDYFEYLRKFSPFKENLIHIYETCIAQLTIRMFSPYQDIKFDDSLDCGNELDGIRSLIFLYRKL